MNEEDFRRLLELFPTVRSRDYQSSTEPTNRSAQDEVNKWHDDWNDREKKAVETGDIDNDDGFWDKLKSAAEKKVGATEAEKFCKEFQQMHKKLVYNDLSADDARKFIYASGSSKG